jgi:hypothetical protein
MTMTNTYLVHAWCDRPFIAYLYPVEAASPAEAIAIARRQRKALKDAAEECNGKYPWDEFAAYDESGNELLHVLDKEARLQNAAPVMLEALTYVAQVLADFKPDALRQLGLDIVMEQAEKALTLVSNTTTKTSAVAVEHGRV